VLQFELIEIKSRLGSIPKVFSADLLVMAYSTDVPMATLFSGVLLNNIITKMQVTANFLMVLPVRSLSILLNWGSKQLKLKIFVSLQLLKNFQQSSSMKN